MTRRPKHHRRVTEAADDLGGWIVLSVETLATQRLLESLARTGRYSSNSLEHA